MKRNDLARVACQAAFLGICLSISLGSQSARADDSAKPENSKPGDTTTAIGVVHHPNLKYRTVNCKALMLDVVSPKVGAGPFPAVVLIHGTGPFSKGKEGMIPLAQEVARNGFVAIAVSYRYTPEDAFPAPIEDVQCAIRWVRANANQFKVDKDRIGVLGFSGGGTLACLLGTKGYKNALGDQDKKGSGPLRAIVSFYGPTDFARLHGDCQKKAKEGSLAEQWQSDLIMKRLEKWFGGPPSIVRENYALPSPMSKDFQECPPVFLIHGSEDSVVSVEQSRLLAKKLRNSSRPVKLLVFEGAGHDFEAKNTTDGHLAVALVLAFLGDHLQSTSNGTPLVKNASN